MYLLQKTLISRTHARCQNKLAVLHSWHSVSLYAISEKLPNHSLHGKWKTILADIYFHLFEGDILGISFFVSTISISCHWNIRASRSLSYFAFQNSHKIPSQGREPSGPTVQHSPVFSTSSIIKNVPIILRTCLKCLNAKAANSCPILRKKWLRFFHSPNRPPVQNT